MESPSVTIQMVTWNSAIYLPVSLPSIFEQTFADFRVLVIDNNSADETVKFIKENYPQITLLVNRQNLGFAKAHNQGFKLLDSEYVLVMNPDVVLEPSYLEVLVKSAQNNPEVASFVGKVYKMHWREIDLHQVERANILDSLGIKISKNRQAQERGGGEFEQGQYEKEEKIFGVSGALAFYRREALEQVKLKTSKQPEGEYFDENFFAYKEDVDLAWRLQLVGWQALYVPGTRAFHFRAVGKPKEETVKAYRQARRKRGQLKNFYSAKNQWLLLVKNDSLGNLLLDSPWILSLELKKLFYFLFFEAPTLKAVISFFRQLPQALTKRALIKIKTKVKPSELRKKWFK